ncbi:leucyl aminopeptidase [Frankia sp. CcI49]|uniref:leucyl aminopeptidase n=1 Tax=Frankia sp. CcI49 TaxID=1745382 RepID=UPI000977399F|nr:leucyl aminopeptidase [Frankia sp. CcI49]ONH61236.1 leucyl aminopeptidase [Frankia sp. CcI49]
MTVTSVAATALTDLDVDAIVVGIAKGADGPVPLGGTGPLDSALGGRLARILADLGATGAAGDTVRFATLGTLTAPTVLAVGLGDHSTFLRDAETDHEALRRAAGAAVRALAGTTRVATTLALAGGEASPSSLRAAAEGSLLGAYAFDSLRAASTRPAPVQEIVLVVEEPAAVAAAEAALARAVIVSESVALVRDLVNTPPSHLSPARLAEIAVERAGAVGVEVTVLDEDALADGAFGGLLGVGQGSVNPPRLIRLRYAGAGEKTAGEGDSESTGSGDGAAVAATGLALVGKGITFDSGGLSLKPPVAMEWMKSDMAGAASVLASVIAAARLGLAINLTGWMPCAENMPSGEAIRPSDVITLRGGKRVEVLNTDAEGRLVLGDALARASEDHPALIVDVATLTGAQIVALGTRTSGVMGRGDAPDAVVTAAGRAGETVWPMPMPAELRKSLDSVVADLTNVAPGGNRDAGMLLAAHFLAAFVPEEIPWAHVDIAGPSWNGGEAYGYTPKGGTGAIVRTLVQLAEDRAATS